MDPKRLGWFVALVFAAVLCAGVMAVAWSCRGLTTVLIVRHAERERDQDALSAAGLARARELARVVERAGVRAIYHSDTDRARGTASPAAVALGITPVEIPALNVQGLVQHVFAHHRGGTVLVVGHSNTVPRIIAAAGGPSLEDLPEGEFDDLFVLTVRGWPGRSARLVSLQYGAATPSLAGMVP